MKPKLDASKIVGALLHRLWQRDCEINVAYMPPHPREDTKPTVVIRHKKSGMFLRYSKGPRQGYFWDVYGEDFLTPEIAIVALSEAPQPAGTWWSNTDHHSEGFDPLIEVAD
jgi:hypothetical protein